MEYPISVLKRLTDTMNHKQIADLHWVIDCIRQYGYYNDGGACATRYASILEKLMYPSKTVFKRRIPKPFLKDGEKCPKCLNIHPHVCTMS